jgi:hypothetical protein
VTDSEVKNSLGAVIKVVLMMAGSPFRLNI